MFLPGRASNPGPLRGSPFEHSQINVTQKLKSPALYKLHVRDVKNFWNLLKLAM